MITFFILACIFLIIISLLETSISLYINQGREKEDALLVKLIKIYRKARNPKESIKDE